MMKTLTKTFIGSLLVLNVSNITFPVYAATFKATVEVTPPVSSPTHDGTWFYNVEVIEGTPPQVKLTVTGTPGVVNGFNNDQFIGDMYTYNATESNGKFTFGGFSNTLAITDGMFNPETGELMFPNPVQSGPSEDNLIGTYNISGIMPVPEPTSILSLLSLGILGVGATLKRKVKRINSIEKEPTKVG